MKAAVRQFDKWADTQLERLRGNPVADRVMNTATTLGDFSVIWHLVGAGRALGGGQRPKQAVVLSALLGAESLIVNQGIKRLFRRTRPTDDGDPRFEVRKPSTSSFPSGHASSAFFAASVLSWWDGRRSLLLWLPLAVVVALSRAYVRIHHASDVVAGAVVGSLLGRMARSALRKLG
jgi:membrane-associated phospholipid phosphatase